MRIALASIILVAAASLASAVHAEERMYVYVGTYTGTGSEGIYRFTLDPKTGTLTPAGVTGGVKNPSFLAITPDGKHLYSVAEVETHDGQRAGGVCAFDIDPKTGELTKLNDQPSGSPGPCHVSVDRTGRVAMVANYGGGSVASLPIEADGKLKPVASFYQHEGHGPNKARQEGPHAHSINPDLKNQFAMACDLGTDKVMVYKLDPASGTLTPNDPASVSVPPGGGPRHFAFHPAGKLAYTNNELTSTVTALRYDDAKGVLTPIETVTTLPEGATHEGNTTAEVQVHPSGRFVYVSNRGHDSIAGFAIDEKAGGLKPIGHTPSGGAVPRNFGIDPSGRFLLAANQETGNVVVFRIDEKSGALTPTGSKVDAPMACCVKFLKIE